MSAQYKNINNTKLDKSILCNKSCDNDKVNLGQVRFLEGLHSLVERTVASVYALNDGIVSAVLCNITPDSRRRRMQCFCMFVRSGYDSCSESSYLVLGVGPHDRE